MADFEKREYRKIVAWINTRAPDFLPEAKRSGYVCPVCGNGHGSDGTGVCRNPHNGKWHCFRCGFDGDVVDLYREFRGICEWSCLLGELCAHYGIRRRAPDEKPAELLSEGSPLCGTGGYTDFYHQAAAANDYRYLESRGIDRSLQRRFLVGYVNNWRSDRAVQKFLVRGSRPEHVPASPRCIIPRTRYCYLARDVREELSPRLRRYSKMAEGRLTEPFHARAFDRSPVVFVTEGEIDAMSIEAVGGHAAALCGVNGSGVLLDYLAGTGKYAVIILLLDNNEAGRSAQKKLARQLKELRIPCMEAGYPNEDIWDPNRYLLSDRAGLADMVRRYQEEGLRRYGQRT